MNRMTYDIIASSAVESIDTKVTTSTGTTARDDTWALESFQLNEGIPVILEEESVKAL